MSFRLASVNGYGTRLGRRALQTDLPVPVTVGDLLKAMRALEGPDPLEDLLE